MRRIRLLPEWYERSLLWDVSEMVQPLGIRVRTMATPSGYYDFFAMSTPWGAPMHTVELCGLLLSEIPELAEEAPQWPRRMRREANIWRPGPFVGPTVVCRVAGDGRPELVIAKRSRDPWLALF